MTTYCTCYWCVCHRTIRNSGSSHKELQKLVANYDTQVNTIKAQVLAEQQLADSTIQKQTMTIRDLRHQVERLQVRSNYSLPTH